MISHLQMENYILGSTAKTTDWYDNGAPFSYYVVTTSDDDKTKPDEEKIMKKVVRIQNRKILFEKRRSSWKIHCYF